ncbi:MAG: hypothetical protein V2A72_00645 [Candidatus Omnitrophota bacterium]
MLKKLVLFVILTTLILPQQSLALRPAATKGKTPSKIISASLEKSIHELDFSVERVKRRKKVTPLINIAYRDKVDAGYEYDSILAKAYTPESLNTDECIIFKIGRLRVICFEARPELPQTTGYAQCFSTNPDEKFFDKAYVLSIENKKQEIVGHGILTYSIDTPHTVFFRYSIHGRPHTAHVHDFSRKGYGPEALAALMIIAKRGNIFPPEIDEFQYIIFDEDFRWRAPQGRSDNFREMKKFLLKMGFVDETDIEVPIVLKFFMGGQDNFTCPATLLDLPGAIEASA